jgi:hypothetical protein
LYGERGVVRFSFLAYFFRTRRLISLL